MDGQAAWLFLNTHDSYLNTDYRKVRTMPEEIELSDAEIDRILQERARIISKSLDDDTEHKDARQFLTFPIGEEKFGIDIRFVQEIHPLAGRMWSPVPGAPDFIAGAVNIRGRIYSMMNIAQYFGIKTDWNPDLTHVLLIRERVSGDGGRMEFCIITGDIPKIEEIVPTGIRSPSGAVSQKLSDYLDGVTESMVMILNIQKLIDDPGIIVNDEI